MKTKERKFKTRSEGGNHLTLRQMLTRNRTACKKRRANHPEAVRRRKLSEVRHARKQPRNHGSKSLLGSLFNLLK